jgi:polyketide cyclase/dehydrase/lipid transport protein
MVATVSINISPNGVHADASVEGGEPDAGDDKGATVLTLPMPPVLPGQPTAPVSYASIDLPVSAEAAWPVVSDLSRLDEWLTIHDDWVGDLPAELATGAELVQNVTLTGWSGAVNWKVDEFRSPNLLRLTGTGLRDTGVKLELTVEPIGYWSRVVAELEFTGEASEGAAGIVLELGGTRELETSLTNLEQLVAP